MWEHACMTCLCRSNNNCVKLTLSFCLYMASNNRIQVSRLVWQAPLPPETSWGCPLSFDSCFSTMIPKVTIIFCYTRIFVWLLLGSGNIKMTGKLSSLLPETTNFLINIHIAIGLISPWLLIFYLILKSWAPPSLFFLPHHISSLSISFKCTTAYSLTCIPVLAPCIWLFLSSKPAFPGSSNNLYKIMSFTFTSAKQLIAACLRPVTFIIFHLLSGPNEATQKHHYLRLLRSLIYICTHPLYPIPNISAQGSVTLAVSLWDCCKNKFLPPCSSWILTQGIPSASWLGVFYCFDLGFNCMALIYFSREGFWRGKFGFTNDWVWLYWNGPLTPQLYRKKKMFANQPGFTDLNHLLISVV